MIGLYVSSADSVNKVSTVIASIIRRTKALLHVRVYCTDFEPLTSFTSRNLKVDFVKCHSYLITNLGSLKIGAFEIINDILDWDRCIVMSSDQIALKNKLPRKMHKS